MGRHARRGRGPGAAPALELRRKQRDFEFPDAGGRRPVPRLRQLDLPARRCRRRPRSNWASRVDGSAGRRRPPSRSRARSTASPVEVLRRTRTVTFDSSRRRRAAYREEILDVDDRRRRPRPRDDVLLRARPAPACRSDARGALPAVRHADRGAPLGSDAVRPAARHPPSARRRPRGRTRRRGRDARGRARTTGQLASLHRPVFGAGYGSPAQPRRRPARPARRRHGRLPDAAPPRVAWLGWDLSHGKPIPIQRHEIKYAARALRRDRHACPARMLWVKRLTGWDARVKEFWRNVFFTNDLGNPDDPADHGSRTVDTADAGAARGSRHVRGRAWTTCTTRGAGQDDRYALQRDRRLRDALSRATTRPRRPAQARQACCRHARPCPALQPARRRRDRDRHRRGDGDRDRAPGRGRRR